MTIIERGKQIEIWGSRRCPPKFNGKIYIWSVLDKRNGKNQIYLTDIIENYCDRIKKRYIEIIYEIGQTLVNGKSIVEHLKIDEGLSLWWMSTLSEKSFYKSERIIDCLKLIVIDEELKKEKPFIVYINGFNDNLLLKAIINICRKHKINYSVERKIDKEYFETYLINIIYRSKILNILNGIYYLREILRRWPLRWRKGCKLYFKKNAIFFMSYFIHLRKEYCSNGIFNSMHWSTLPDILNKHGIYSNLMHIFIFSKEVPDTKTGLKWINSFNLDKKKQGAHCFLESYISAILIITCFKKWLKIVKKIILLKKTEAILTKNKKINLLWPILQYEWNRSTIGSIGMLNVLWAELFREALHKIPKQRLGVYLYENQGWEKAFLYFWKKYGHGKIIGFAHSTIRYWDLRYFEDKRFFKKKDSDQIMPDIIAINSEKAKEDLIKNGYPKEKLVEVEALRFLELRNIQIQRDRNSKLPNKILVLGDFQKKITKSLFNMIEELPKHILEQSFITVKAHPGNPIEINNQSNPYIKMTAEPLSELLKDNTIVLCANATSAAFEAFIVGLPVIIYIMEGEINQSPLRGEKEVYYISTSADLVRLLETKNIYQNRTKREYTTWIDSNLPRWRSLIGF